MSISFDRAAAYYDDTRGLPPETMEQVVAALADRMRPLGRSLEIGAGTGRFVVPLRQAGLDLFGVDISALMLARLREKEPGALAVRGDATALPFGDGVFGAALGVHVLHLIPAWRRALAEVARVVRRRGLVLIDPGGPDNPVERRFFEEAGADARHAGLQSPEDLEHEMALLGATAEPPLEIPTVLEVEVGRYIDRLEAGLYSRTWGIEPEVRGRAAVATRAWAGQALGDIEQPLRVERTLTFRVYRLG